MINNNEERPSLYDIDTKPKSSVSLMKDMVSGIVDNWKNRKSTNDKATKKMR